MTSRRNFFKAAGALAGAAVIPSAPALAKGAAAQSAKADAPRILKSGVEVGAPLPGFDDFEITKTFHPGKSTLQEGVVMNASHWGIGRVHVKGGRIQRIEPFEKDLSPSLQLQAVAQQPYNRARIRYPMVRKSWLEKGYKAGGKDRGAEPFVRVSWEKAAKLVADEIKRVRDTYGPASIYGGSYGWMSPGAVGNARNLLGRVLNLAGGFTGGLGDYSTGCAQVILPYVIGSNGVYEQVTGWDLICDKTELIVLWGADPLFTNDIDWATTVHENADGFRRVKAKGIPVVAVNPSEEKKKLGTVGPAFRNYEIEIRDREGNKIGLHEEGVLYLKGPAVVHGYFRDEENTRERFTPDGWFNTGDVVRIDEDGYIKIVDRATDIIIVSGFNVYPQEVEAVLCKHPAVHAAVAVGEKNKVAGELVKAFIILNEGAQATPKELMEYCKDHLAHYKVPRKIGFVKEYPISQTGKILRRELRKMKIEKEK